MRIRVARLDGHARAIEGHREAVEQAFVAAGAGLQQQSRLTAELAQQAAALAEFAASGSNPVTAAIHVLSSTLTRLETLHEGSSRLVDKLHVQHREIAQLQQNGWQLERAIAPLRIVDTLFRIEAATLPPEMQAAFAALTSEIAHLDAQVRETFTRHFEGLGATRDAIAQAIERVEEQHQEQVQTAREQRAFMRESIVALENGLIRLQQRQEGATRLVARIDEETNAVMVALQYQDITRQKLEHVMSALAALPGRAAAGEEATALAFVGQAARLQANQLAALEQDLERAIAGIDAGLSTVISGLAEVEADGLAAADCVAIAERVTEATDALLGMLGRMPAPMHALAEHTRATAEAVRSFGGVTSDLGETIRALTWGIRLIALNAQVQAAQVARCDGLEVLARHIYGVSEETNGLADKLGLDLGVLTAQIGETVALAAQMAVETAAAEQELEGTLKSTTTRLAAVRTRVVGALRRIPPLLQETGAHATELLARADLAGVDRRPLRTLRGELEELSAWCGERAPSNATAAVRAEFATLERQYTMESERTVHTAVLAGRPAVESGSGARIAVAVPPAEPDPGKAATTGAALGDNVELF